MTRTCLRCVLRPLGFIYFALDWSLETSRLRKVEVISAAHWMPEAAA